MVYILVGTILATGQFAALPVHYPSMEACEKKIVWIEQSVDTSKWKFDCYLGEKK